MQIISCIRNILYTILYIFPFVHGYLGYKFLIILEQKIVTKIHIIQFQSVKLNKGANKINFIYYIHPKM